MDRSRKWVKLNATHPRTLCSLSTSVSPDSTAAISSSTSLISALSDSAEHGRSGKSGKNRPGAAPSPAPAGATATTPASGSASSASAGTSPRLSSECTSDMAGRHSAMTSTSSAWTVANSMLGAAGASAAAGARSSGSGVRAFVASVSWSWHSDGGGEGDGVRSGVGDMVNEPSLVGNFWRHS